VQIKEAGQEERSHFRSQALVWPDSDSAIFLGVIREIGGTLLLVWQCIASRVDSE
jgi:hypothetical protein